MKTNYQEPEVEVTLFESEDIITTSGSVYEPGETE